MTQDDESLEKRASRLEKEAKDFSRRISNKKDSLKRETKESPSEILGEIRGYKKSLIGIKNTLLGIYEKVFSPFVLLLAPPIKWLWDKYSKIWQRFAYKGEGEERVICKKRAGTLTGLTILFFLTFTPTAIGNFIRYFTVEPIMDSALILTSKRTEEFFLNHSAEIDPENNVHSVRGCNALGKCSEINAVYFRVRPRLAHDVWKLINYGNPLYITDHVVAPIAPGVNRCQVTYYGYRMTTSSISRLMRSMQVYPTMLEADCEFLRSSE